MQRFTLLEYNNMLVSVFGDGAMTLTSAAEQIVLLETIKDLRNEIEALKAIIDADRMQVVGECECLPLDGGLGSTTCQSCRDNAPVAEDHEDGFPF